MTVVFSPDLLNVFEVFLPQLLLYPNPSDPLNGDAASLMMKDRKMYDEKVKGKHIGFTRHFQRKEKKKTKSFELSLLKESSR